MRNTAVPNTKQRVLNLFLERQGAGLLKKQISKILGMPLNTVGVKVADLKSDEILSSCTVRIFENGKRKRFQLYFLTEKGRKLAKLDFQENDLRKAG